MSSEKKGRKFKPDLNNKLELFRKNFKNFVKKRSKKQVSLIIILAIIASLYLLRSLFFVAFVNGFPIMRIEFTKELERNFGQETLDNLITKKLILQEASKKGVAVSNDEVEEEIDNISSLIESQGSSLDLVLSSQGQTIKDLEENIRIQKTVEKILEDKVTVPEEDLIEYFDNNSELYGEDADFAELKEDIRQQLRQEKLSSEFETWINHLKTESKIIYFLNF